jgi:hypothetical protein
LNFTHSLSFLVNWVSLGIPTYRYGHEPSNRFATFHAKYFSNALREDILLGICTGGIIFTRGGPGTRQEIFQAACHNHYTIDAFVRPMVLILSVYLFVGCDHNTSNTLNTNILFIIRNI